MSHLGDDHALRQRGIYIYIALDYSLMRGLHESNDGLTVNDLGLRVLSHAIFTMTKNTGGGSDRF